MYKDVADFAMVYILEAHATNEWPINNLPEGVSSLNQHVTLQDRQDACKLFQQTYSSLLHPQMKIVLDGAENQFNELYPSWPFRLWILDKDMIIRFKGMANANSGYNVNLQEIALWLRNYSIQIQRPEDIIRNYSFYKPPQAIIPFVEPDHESIVEVVDEVETAVTIGLDQKSNDLTPVPLPLINNPEDQTTNEQRVVEEDILIPDEQ